MDEYMARRLLRMDAKIDAILGVGGLTAVWLGSDYLRKKVIAQYALNADFSWWISFIGIGAALTFIGHRANAD